VALRKGSPFVHGSVWDAADDGYPSVTKRNVSLGTPGTAASAGIGGELYRRRVPSPSRCPILWSLSDVEAGLMLRTGGQGSSVRVGGPTQQEQGGVVIWAAVLVGDDGVQTSTKDLGGR
jgi:hypothetical protein